MHYDIANKGVFSGEKVFCFSRVRCPIHRRKFQDIGFNSRYIHTNYGDPDGEWDSPKREWFLGV
jgi:hypothetical protein